MVGWSAAALRAERGVVDVPLGTATRTAARLLEQYGAAIDFAPELALDLSTTSPAPSGNTPLRGRPDQERSSSHE